MNFDSLKSDLLSLADTGLKYAKSAGADQAEIYVSSLHSTNVRNQSGMIDARDGLNEGIGVQIAVGKKLGFAAMSSLTTEALKHAISEALSIAQSSNDNLDFESFAQRQKPAKDGILDKDIHTISTEDIVNNVNVIYTDAKNFDKRIVSVNAQAQIAYGGYAVANSSGIADASLFTAFVLLGSSTAMEGAKRKSAYDFSVTRTKPEDFNIGSQCAEKAIRQLDSKPLDFTGVLPTIWNQIAMDGFWTASLLSSVNGRQIVEKNSYFMDKLGDKVGVDELTITDDGQLAEGLNTSCIDEEGIPQQTTKVIENGVLHSFLYNNYYGSLGKTKSTGNAHRAEKYEATPSISPTTIVINPGTKSFDEILSEIDKGIFVVDFVMGMLHSNLISGDFSVVTTSAFLVEKSEIVHALEPITIAGNLYRSFKDILYIGSDSRLLESVKTPSVVFDGFTVNG